MKYIKKFENYNQDMLSKPYEDPSVGDEVYINYEIPGGNGDNVPTPVKIKSIKGSGRKRAYIVSHNVDLSQFKNAPDQAIRRSDIIGPHKGIDTPVGPGWASGKPNTPTHGDQVSNDMYL